MTAKRDKSAKPTQADKRAAARLLALWNAHVTAARLRGERVTQESAGAAMGMTQGAVSQFLNGQVGLGYGPLLKFSEFLGIAPTEIRDDLDSLPREPLTNPQEAIEELRMDVLALRTVIVALAASVTATIPTIGDAVSDVLRAPEAKLPVDRGFLREFLRAVERVNQEAEAQTSRATTATARKFRS